MANIYKNTKTDLTAASATTIYTVPSDSRSIVKSILVNDDSGSGDTITLTLTNAAGTVFSLFKVKAVAANTTIELLTKDLVLQSGEVLKVQAAAANRLHVVASIQEISKTRITTSALSNI